MRKTTIAATVSGGLTLLAGVCSAATDPTTTTTALGTNYTVTITFDTSVFDTMAAGTATSAASCLTLLSISSDSYPIGAALGYSSSSGAITSSGIFTTSDTAGNSAKGSYLSSTWSYSYYVNGVVSTANVTDDSTTTLGNVVTSVDWTSIGTAALTMTYDYTTGSPTIGTTLYLSYVDASGDVCTYVGYQSGLRYSTHSGTAINVDSDYATLISYSTTTATVAEAIALNTAVIAIPEPSAFGLLAGLGALALVVSRRSRKCRK